MHEFTAKDQGIIKKTGIALIISLICYFILSIACCLGLFLSGNPTSSIKIISLVSYLLSGAVSGFVCAKVIKSQPILTSVIAATIFSCALFILSIFSGGNMLNMTMNVVCYILINAFFAYLGSIKRKKSVRRRR